MRFDRILAGSVIAVGVGALLLVAFAAAPPAEESAARAGSTHVSSPDGAKALYEYLGRAGLTPSRVDTADLETPPGAALALVMVSLDDGEAAVLLDRVEDGLFLFVASGDPRDPLLASLGLPVSADGVAGRAQPAFPSNAVAGVKRVEVEGALRGIPGGDRGVLAGEGWIELLADDAGAVALARSVGAGAVIVVLDPTMVTNGGLPKAHNLRFADSALRTLAGESGRVVFDEFHHGFGVERTVGGWIDRAGLLPAVWLALLAIGADAWRRNRARVGPPRPMPQPERRAVREFVVSYAGLLRATGHRAWAVRAVEKTLRRRLHDELGIPLSAPPKEVFRRLTTRVPRAAARAYRALERASELGRVEAAPTDRELLEISRDVHEALSALHRRIG